MIPIVYHPGYKITAFGLERFHPSIATSTAASKTPWWPVACGGPETKCGPVRRDATIRHAASAWGGGFCVNADVPMAVKALHNEGKVGRVLVVDLDAHQGNGTAAVFHGWDWASILHLYERDIFQSRKESEDFPLAFSPGLTVVEYLEIVRDTLPVALDAVRPDLVVFNDGSDPFVGDPLAWYRLTAGDLAERDLLVVTEVRGRGIPLGMVLSGGDSAESWTIHADAIEGILARFVGAC